MLMPDCTLWIYSPYLKSIHAKKLIFWGLAIFLIIFPLQPWHILKPKAARRTTSEKFLQAVPEYREESSLLAPLIPLQEYLWHPFIAFPDLHAYFIDSCFLLFLFSHKCPFYTFLFLTGLCPAPPDGTTTCGFVFFSRASLQVCLLLDSAA